MILVGKKAPVFKAPAVLGNGEIVDSYDFAKAIQGKYTVVVFYPLDFTFVCPSELIVLDKRTAKLKEARCRLFMYQLTHILLIMLG